MTAAQLRLLLTTAKLVRRIIQQPYSLTTSIGHDVLSREIEAVIRDAQEEVDENLLYNCNMVKYVDARQPATIQDIVRYCGPEDAAAEFRQRFIDGKSEELLDKLADNTKGLEKLDIPYVPIIESQSLDELDELDEQEHGEESDDGKR